MWKEESGRSWEDKRMEEVLAIFFSSCREKVVAGSKGRGTRIILVRKSHTRATINARETRL